MRKLKWCWARHVIRETGKTLQSGPKGRQMYTRKTDKNVEDDEQMMADFGDDVHRTEKTVNFWKRSMSTDKLMMIYIMNMKINIYARIYIII